MKKLNIRFKLTFWFIVILIAGLLITFFVMRAAGGIVLRRTIRSYLVSTVEENVKKISYSSTRKYPESNNYIAYGRGFLEIDVDFMEVADNVYTALYAEDGTILYGENPITLMTKDTGFTTSHLWEVVGGRDRYDIYDRKLLLELPDGQTLWIRGTVSEADAMTQLDEITRISLILLPFLAVIAILVSYLLIGRKLAPLSRIENTAAAISKGDDLEQRITVKNTNDEVGRLAESFNRMLDRLEYSFEVERQFTSDVSHELRTPASVILAQTEYTLEKERTAAEYEEALQVIMRQGKRMDMLISDMLDYTRMDQRSDMYPCEPLDLSEVVSDTARQMSLIGARNISLEVQAEEGIYINGNRLLLVRLLNNLITNAYRYGRDDGHIWVTLAEMEKGAELAVADDGIGIAEEEQERIFDRFYRSDASRSLPGTGLGLSLVKKIAEIHHASVELDSQEGAGSTFRIIFQKLSEH